jgi:hypothetical protein
MKTQILLFILIVLFFQSRTFAQAEVTQTIHKAIVELDYEKNYDKTRKIFTVHLRENILEPSDQRVLFSTKDKFIISVNEVKNRWTKDNKYFLSLDYLILKSNERIDFIDKKIVPLKKKVNQIQFESFDLLIDLFKEKNIYNYLQIN